MITLALIGLSSCSNTEVLTENSIIRQIDVLESVPSQSNFSVMKDSIKRDFFVNALGQTRYPDYQAQLDHGMSQAKLIGADAVVMFKDDSVIQFLQPDQQGATAYAATLIKYND